MEKNNELFESVLEKINYSLDHDIYNYRDAMDFLKEKATTLNTEQIKQLRERDELELRVYLGKVDQLVAIYEENIAKAFRFSSADEKRKVKKLVQELINEKDKEEREEILLDFIKEQYAYQSIVEVVKSLNEQTHELFYKKIDRINHISLAKYLIKEILRQLKMKKSAINNIAKEIIEYENN